MTWSDIPRDPPPQQLRTFAGILLGLAGAMIVLRGSRNELILVAAGVGVVGLVHPRAVRLLFVSWLMAVFPIGWLVSHVLLAVVYYGIFTPLGFGFRLFGRDELHRRRPMDVESYWQPKPAPQGLQSYFRQF